MKLPKSWKDITIGQYQQLLPSNYKKLNDVESIIHTLHVVTGLSKDDVRKISLKDVKTYQKKLSFLNEAYKGHYKKKFKVNGRWYRVEPDANSLEAGQYMDVMTLIKDLGKDNEAIEKNLHLLLAVVCKPIKLTIKGWKDMSLDIIKTSEEFYNHLTMDIANPIIVFFCLLSKHSTEIIENYLKRQVEKTEKELSAIQEDLNNTGGGI